MKKLFLLSLLAIQPVLSLCNPDQTGQNRLTAQQIDLSMQNSRVAIEYFEAQIDNDLLMPGIVSGAGFLAIIATQGFTKSIGSLWGNLDFKAQCAALACLGITSTTAVIYHQAAQRVKKGRDKLYEMATRAIYDIGMLGNKLYDIQPSHNVNNNQPFINK